MSTNTAHILVYPFPAPGHIIPLLDLTHLLLTHGLSITLLITPNNQPLLHSFLCSHTSSHLQHLVLPDPPRIRLLACMRSLRQQHYPILLNWFQSHPSPPFAIISDFFLGWTHQLACQLAIPRLVFSPSGAFAFSVTTSLWRNQPQTENPNNVDFMVSFPEIPNSPTYPWWQISHIYRTSKEGDPDREFFRDCFLANFESWGVVINSFVELERVHIEHLKGNSGIGSDRVWSVGPLLLHDDGGSIGSLSRGGSSSVPRQQVITWLEEKGDNSVVYICFGSREMLTCKQMDELASGLEKSGINFIWSVRQPNERHASAECGVLPDGFEDRVAGRGFIIKGWAPQVAILRNRAVGVFDPLRVELGA